MKIVLQDWKYGRIMRYTHDVYIGNSLVLPGSLADLCRIFPDSILKNWAGVLLQV